ncbi:hypothetical protein [Brevundimonas sp. FT23028]|uniref:hypothetical protein n=1 Tax=Brevundimonas sp. FT23028 TaxID=3393748 RepID=UPI003B58750D
MARQAFSDFAPNLSAIEDLSFAAGKGLYWTGAGSPALYDLTSFGRSLSAAADDEEAREALNLVIGVDVQAFSDNLASFGGLTLAANKIVYATGPGAVALTDFTPAAWTNWTPTITTTTPAGSGFSATVTTAKYAKNGRTVHVALNVTLSNLGSGPAASGNLTVTLPFPAANAAQGFGTENALTGHMVQGNVSAETNVLTIKKYDASTVVATGAQVRLTMTYEATA